MKISQETLDEVARVAREWPDGVHTCEELQRTEPGRRPCTCGRCGSRAQADTTVTDAQLQAAFLAARGLGKVLDDDVLRAIILAAEQAS